MIYYEHLRCFSFEKVMIIMDFIELIFIILSARIHIVKFQKSLEYPNALQQPPHLTSHFFAQTRMSDLFTSYLHVLKHFQHKKIILLYKYVIRQIHQNKQWCQLRCLTQDPHALEQ